MIPHVLRVVFVLLFIGLIVYMLRPRPLFVLEIRARKVGVRKGKVSAGFLRDCESMVTMHDIPDGTIAAYPSRAGVSFRFSRGIPSQYHQNFRNIWHLSGS